MLLIGNSIIEMQVDEEISVEDKRVWELDERILA